MRKLFGSVAAGAAAPIALAFRGKELITRH
jgi:hypothetical protein